MIKRWQVKVTGASEKMKNIRRWQVKVAGAGEKMKNIRRWQVKVAGAGEKRKNIPIRCCLMLLAMVLVMILTSCAMLIARFDPVSLQNATALKQESLNLMDKATEPYEQHQGEIEELEIKLENAFLYSQSIPKNTISAKQWKILIRLLKRIFNHWQASTKLSPVFIREVKKDVSAAFDEVIKLEKGKPGVWQGAGSREQNKCDVPGTTPGPRLQAQYGGERCCLLKII